MGELFTGPGGLWRRLPRYLAVAPFLGGRRVLDLGCGEGRGAAWLAAGRSREVVGVDEDAELTSHAERTLGRPGLSFVEAGSAALPFSDRSFDAALVMDGELLQAGLSEAVTELKRVLAPGGFVAIALDNPARKALPVSGESGGAPGDGTGHGLFAALRRRFARVRLIGQAPVIGFLFGDLAAPDGGWSAPSLSVDLLDGDVGEQDAWMALCWDDGASAPGFDPTLVRLPFDGLADHLLAEAAERDLRAQSAREGTDQAEDFQARLDELETALREAVRDAETAGGRSSPAAAPDREGLRLRSEVAARERRIEDLEAEIRARAARMDESASLVVALEESAEQARAAAGRWEQEVQAERRERDRLVAEVAERERRITSLELRVYGALGEDAGPAERSPADEAWREERERADVLQDALLGREDRITELEAELMTLRTRLDDPDEA